MNKSAALGFRINERMKAMLVKAAQDDSRSVSSMVDKIIAEWLRENGYMKPIKKPGSK